MDLLRDRRINYVEQVIENISVTESALNGKEFENCTFRKCTFIQTKFEACLFSDCVFEECVISACNMRNCSLLNAKFSHSKVIGIDWTKTKNFRLVEFNQSDISFSNFGYMKLRHLKLTDSIAKEVEFDNCDLSEAICTGTDFENSRFSTTNLTKADLRGAHHYAIDIHNNRLKKTRFSLPEAISLLNSLEIVIDGSY